MIDSTNPRILADNIRALSGEAGSQASDISALQSTVTALGTYSTDEVNTGKKFLDKDVYRKTFYTEMPNATTKVIASGIENIDICVNLYGVIQARAGEYNGRLIGTPGAGTIVYSPTTIEVVTSTDLSGNFAYIVMEYTKSAAPSPDLVLAPDDTRSIEPEPEVRESEEPVIDEPIEEPVKKTTRKKTTTE